MNTCKYFKHYKGIYPPKCKCDSCWKLYNTQQLYNTTNVKLIKGKQNDTCLPVTPN